jgi:transposase-like protein
MTISPRTRDLAVEMYVAGLSLRQTADQLDVSHGCVLRWLRQAGVKTRPNHGPVSGPEWAYPTGENVSLVPFRDVFRRSGLTVSDVARRMGVDEAQAARLLGTRAMHSSKRGPDGQRRRYRSIQRTARYDTAARLCRALDADPIDLGI